MAKLRVHVVLSPAARKDPDLRDQAIHSLKTLGLGTHDASRAQLFGIVSGTVESERLPSLRTLPEVVAVEVDGFKSALSAR